MNIDQSEQLIMTVISEIIEGEVSNEMQLIGEKSVLDSMHLVEVCLALEDVAEEHGFQFDWTSEATMSKSRSMFRNVAELAKEFADQSGSKS